MQKPVTRLDYCQYLPVSQINYTLTHFADHCAQFSHDAINRYLRDERVTPRLIWEHVRAQVRLTPRGYVLFDDTVRDKNSSCAIELVRRLCAAMKPQKGLCQTDRYYACRLIG